MVNNYMIWHFLKVCFDAGWIYKGKDSVPWCPRCETAISQHEMLTEDYKEITHETVYFKSKVKSQKSHVFKALDNLYLLAWTTTPWTIPGNVALAINTDLEYVVVVHIESDDRLILAKDRLEATLSEDTYEVVQTVKGTDLIGLSYQGPFEDLEKATVARGENEALFHTVVDGSDIVSSEEGVGILHLAPGQGKEDFDLGRTIGLPFIELIDEEAVYYPGLGEFTGKNAKKHPEIIIDYLKKHMEGRFLLKTMRITHRYPACWRCKSELVWRVADEWYIGMDRTPNPDFEKYKGDSRTLRERMTAVAKKINWIPEFGLDRELDWLKNMHDWLISKKNRYWGLALPIFVNETGDYFEVVGSYDELKARAVSGWDQFEGNSPHKPFIDEVKIKSKDGTQVLTRIGDVGNPWLDAGIVPFSTVTDPSGNVAYTMDPEFFKQWFPADFITESFPGQFKNWFYALIAMSTVLEDAVPYKSVLGFATLQGEDGRPMHKSWGNSIEFNEGADKIGVDVMRFMFARQNPSDNMLFGYKKADEVRRQFYLMLYNVYKYFVEYAVEDEYDVVPKTLTVSEDAPVLDRWIYARLIQVVHHVDGELTQYKAAQASSAIEEFVSDISTWFIRRSRDRVGSSSENESDKASFYQTLYVVLHDLSIILSPFMPFLPEEMYTNLVRGESVHLASWPMYEGTFDEALVHDMVLVREIVAVGQRVRREQKLKVRQPLAKITVSRPKDKAYRALKNQDEYMALIMAELNVKTIDMKIADEAEISCVYDTNLTPELVLEGKYRDLVRTLQQMRKEHNLKSSDVIEITVLPEFEVYEKELKRKLMARLVLYGDTPSIRL